jgi:hypothetical protein
VPQGDQKQIELLSQRILQLCAEKFGSTAALATFLGVPEHDLADWMEGKNLPPASVILTAVDTLVTRRGT